MEQTKDQILGDLYALRAGLSMISQEADKIETIEACATVEYGKIAESSNIKHFLKFERNGNDNYWVERDLQEWMEGDNDITVTKEVPVDEWVMNNYRGYFGGGGYMSQADAEQILQKDDDYKRLNRLTFENCCCLPNGVRRLRLIQKIIAWIANRRIGFMRNGLRRQKPIKTCIERSTG